MAPLQRELHERNIDLAIGSVREPIAVESLTSEVLFDDRLVVAAGAGNKWHRRKRINLSDLSNEPWLLAHRDSLIFSMITEAFRASGAHTPNATVSSNSGRLNNNLLATGRFLTMFPESMIRLGAKHMPCKVLPVRLPNPPVPVVLFTLKNRTLSPAVQLFIDCIREVVKPFAKGRFVTPLNRAEKTLRRARNSE